jgi:dipeptidyl aminopeptidase/acylaminoacyl peptidase
VIDKVMVLLEPNGAPQQWFTTEHRAQGTSYGEDGKLVLCSEFDRDHRKSRLWRARADDLTAAPVKLYERSTQDAYGDPGSPVRITRLDGQSLVRMQGSTLFLSGNGASAEGDRPFLDSWDIDTDKKQRLFQCAKDCLETFGGFLDQEGKTILVRRETPLEPSNAWTVELASGKRTQLTKFTDPAQQFLATVSKQLVRYQRKDGVPLSGTLYLPPGRKPGEKLPALVWAYPQEFNQASDAGQVRGSPFRYQRLAGTSHLFLLCLGYAVLDDAAFPIVGPVRTANDTFVEQLVNNAQAAVDLLVQNGVDPQRIAVAGHSYGAFMTANLLAHCDLFAAGLARSGAYNRTLTPFGFQNEERTYWEAPQIYQAMSPFAHADKIKEPILMIHGEDDNNPGTFPIQSQRLYQAIQGHGGTARLCVLPHESHGYRSRECVLQCLWEMADWMDRHVKNRKVAVEAAGSKG